MSQLVAILLRKTHAINRFRKIILNAINDDNFDEFVICSGFFQENAHYKASSSFNLTRSTPCSITTVGVYNWLWKSQYDTFVTELSKKTTATGIGISVVGLRIPRFHWHAKIFIAKKQGQATLGIIGSSNITKRAFDIDKTFNHECDVVLWLDTDVNASAAARGALEGLENPAEIIIAKYDPGDPLNSGLTLPHRLLDLEKEIRAIAK
jgi:phosphatidylserine/phosphatidylglycerophosphate/cardiolipin synthase-like enzyme